MSAHISRKHPGCENPMPGLKHNRPFNSYFSQPQIQPGNPGIPPDSQPFSSYFSQPQNQTHNPAIPPNSSLDPLKMCEKSINIQKIFQEIKRMSDMEFTVFLSAINKIRFENYSNS